MKKRVFAITAALLFMGSTMSMAPKTSIETDCLTAADYGANALALVFGLSYDAEAALFDALFEECFFQNL